ncbi:hypothetical protein FUT69_00795 [Xylella taiwanensis]|uniref:hypothetical protein n=1 Tax=Xylella taiwanensis TaxID=1444770 RepID=UPI0004ACF36D|nr:hypothetical protein [Xylella taiwanensis]MCD8456156.1 hypothetical protein [Xylella taiwanensis]MCD8458563.1 hypothetical protein [Xylella taiwanensis]MCD8463240.1 hypothetical protein [Xylella taiwanensis]MCD8465203.1 hypothetical protein [Xylella taiwanensis]MCD8467236.1 hypothetical protein [Xylella taiwanensis]
MRGGWLYRRSHGAFHEIIFWKPALSDPLPLYDEAMDWVGQAAHHVFLAADAGERLGALFERACLQLGRLFCELPVETGAAGRFVPWIVASLQSLKKTILELNLAVGVDLDDAHMASHMRDVLSGR